MVKSAEKLGGIGEPATALVVLAIAKSVATLTGKVLRCLPLIADVIKAS